MKDITLPPPALRGTVSLEEALARRRSCRRFQPRPLTLAEIGQLLWAANGLSDADLDRRTTPSAGALYPCEWYVTWAEGTYHYRPRGHYLRFVQQADARELLARAAWQDFVAQAPCVFVVAADYERTTPRYGSRGRERYVPMDAGHSIQNLLLQAVTLGLGSVPVGAFDDAAVAQAMALPSEQTPLCLLPVGWPR